MFFPLSMLPGLPRRTAMQLEQRGVVDTKELVYCGRTPEQRGTLASWLEVDGIAVDSWVSVADLMRLRSLTPPVAKLLVMAGASRTVQEFRELCPGSPWEPDPNSVLAMPVRPCAAIRELVHKLAAFASTRSLMACVPLPEQLAWAMVDADGTPPLVVFDDAEELNRVETRIARLVDGSRRHGGRQSLLLVGALGAVALLMSLALFLLGSRQIVRAMRSLRFDDGMVALEPGLAVLERLSLEVWAYAVVQIVVFLAVVIAFVLTMTLFVDASGRAWMWLCLRFILWDREARSNYLDALEAEVGRANYMHLVSIITYGVALGVGLLMVVLATRRGFGLWLERDLAVALAAIVVPVALALLVPDVLGLRKRVTGQRGGRFRVARAIALVRAGHVARVFVVLIVFLVTLPGVGSVGLNASEAVRSRLAATAILRAVDRLQGLDGGQWMQANVPDIVDTEAFVTDFVMPFTAAMTDRLNIAFGAVLSSALPHFLSALVPSLALIAGLSIVVPFLILGGWMRGTFYMILLGVAWMIQSAAPLIVGSNMTSTFGLAAGSWWVGVFVAVSVFVLAVLSEWVFESTAMRRAECPRCSAYLGVGARFCECCGMAALSCEPSPRGHG